MKVKNIPIMINEGWFYPGDPIKINSDQIREYNEVMNYEIIGTYYDTYFEYKIWIVDCVDLINIIFKEDGELKFLFYNTNKYASEILKDIKKYKVKWEKTYKKKEVINRLIAQSI